jgi:hypothetical protein
MIFFTLVVFLLTLYAFVKLAKKTLREFNSALPNSHRGGEQLKANPEALPKE